MRRRAAAPGDALPLLKPERRAGTGILEARCTVELRPAGVTLRAGRVLRTAELPVRRAEVRGTRAEVLASGVVGRRAADRGGLACCRAAARIIGDPFAAVR